MKYFSLFALSAALLTSSVAVADNAQTPAAAFTPAQTAAIEQIVHHYVVAHPEILIEAGQALQMKQQNMMQEKASKVIPALAASLLNDPNSPVAGNPKGAVSVVEFFDYQCPHCKVMSKEIDGLIKSDPNVRVVYKELPIFGADSEFAAKAALAAQGQGKFLALHEALLNAPGRLSNQTVLDIAKSVGLNVNKLQADMNLPQYTKELQDNAALANKIGISGTPGFVVLTVDKAGKVKSQFIPGQTNQEGLMQAVNAVKQS